MENFNWHEHLYLLLFMIRFIFSFRMGNAHSLSKSCEAVTNSEMSTPNRTSEAKY